MTDNFLFHDMISLVSASFLGVVNHLCYHRAEPTRPIATSLFLVLEPSLLLYFSGRAWSVDSLFIVYAVFFISLCLSIGAYRLSPFHPLSRIPGPIPYKVTKLYGAWICWKGHQQLDWKDLHDEYGPIVRTGPNEVSVIDAQSINAVLGTGGLPKGTYYTCRQAAPPGSTSLILLTGASHASRRRRWSKGLNVQALKDYEVHISERATQLTEKIKDMDAEHLDLVPWLNYFTVDFMGDMAFGGGSELMATDGQGDGIFAMLDIYWRVISAACHIPWAYQATVFMASLLSKRFAGMRPYAAQRATNRAQSGSKTKDLWYHLMDEESVEKSKPPLNDVVADGLLAIVAGADTSSSAMSCMFWCLLSDRECLKRLQHEIDTVFPDGANALDTSKHSELPYLRACINETLRLFPPLPSNGPREVPRGLQGKIIFGHFLPEGTQVYIPPYAIHRNPEYFSPLPDKFVPERWIANSGFSENHNLDAFIPFSFGPASCVGKNLAMQEMMMLTSLLVQMFDMRFVEGFDSAAWPLGILDHFITTRPNLPVVMTPRGQ